MSENLALSPRVIALGEALRPISLKLHTQMGTPTRRTLAVYDLVGSIWSHLDGLGSTVGELETKVRALGRLVSGEGSDADIYRTAGGLEVYIDNLLESCAEIRQWRLGASDAPARDLLAGIYLHVLAEIRDWIDEMLEVIADPVAALERRGLPTSGHVELQLDLILTEAPQLAELRRWAERNITVDHVLPSAPAGKPGLGFCGTVVAAVLGFAIGGFLFGDEE